MNIIEHARKGIIDELFKVNGFNSVWPTWGHYIKYTLWRSSVTHSKIFDLGDHLNKIFITTSTVGRSQSVVAGGGANWEALVCWYLNLANIGRSTIVFKANRLVPQIIKDSLTVNYGNFPSNTESDLIAVTFPDNIDFNADASSHVYTDNTGCVCQTFNSKGACNYTKVLNALLTKHFSTIEINVIQCKTNWNDNAQIPMLWDIVYSASNFGSGVTIGTNGYSMKNCKSFKYSFVTVPTVNMQKIKNSSTSVLRVRNLSGGNYWGNPTKSGVAFSVKEILARNMAHGHNQSHLDTLLNEYVKISGIYSYFQI